MKKKTPKVILDDRKEDYNDALCKLYGEEPIVEETATFKTVSSEYNITNIRENNVLKYFDIIKDSVFNTVNDFKQKDNIKFKIIIGSEFMKSAEAESQKETFYYKPPESLVTMNNFDDVWKNVEDGFQEWLDGFQERGSGLEYLQITKCTIKVARYKSLSGSSYLKLKC